MLAYFVCQLMNVSGKSLVNPISPKELLEPVRGGTVAVERRKQDEEYLAKTFKDALRESGANVMNFPISNL